MTPKRLLTHIELRYVVTLHLYQNGWTTMADLVAMLDYWGFTTKVRPSKAISDAMRTDRKIGRVYRRGRGLYGPGEMPRGTDHRIRTRVLALRAQTQTDYTRAATEPTNLRNAS